jgi:hypothetical protein
VKRILDERGRLFGKLNIVDLIAVLAAAVVAVTAVVKYTGGRSAVGGGSPAAVGTVTVSYQFTIKGIREMSLALFRPGDAVFAEGGKHIGSITAVDSSGATTTTARADGKYVKAPVPLRYDVVLTIEVPCTVSSGRYYANRSFELSVNSEQKIHTKYVDVTGYITALNAARDG